MLLKFSPVILGFLIGSFASAVIVCNLLRLGDPRTEGSGNPGTTNVLRLYGKKAALLTLAGDLLKGVIPVLFTRLMDVPELIIAMAGMAAFYGHLYPVFFNFRGGKGAATMLGVLLASNWILGLAFIVTWLITALFSRYSSLSSMTAALLTPLYTWLLLPASAYFICFTIMTVFLIWRHRENIKRLINGDEIKIGGRDFGA